MGRRVAAGVTAEFRREGAWRPYLSGSFGTFLLSADRIGTHRLGGHFQFRSRASAGIRFGEGLRALASRRMPRTFPTAAYILSIQDSIRSAFPTAFGSEASRKTDGGKSRPDASGTRTAVKTARENSDRGGFPQGELQKDVSPASPSCRKRFSPEECPAGAGRPPQALPGITGAYVPPPRRRRDHLRTLRLPHRPRAPASRTQDPPLRPPSARSRCRCAQGRT